MNHQVKPWLTDEIPRNAATESAAWAELARALSMPLAIEADASLRGLLRSSSQTGEATSFAISQPGGLAWLTLEGDRVTAHRRKPGGMTGIELVSFLSRAGEAVRSALTQGTAFTNAARVLGSFIGAAEVSSRQKFLYLQSWAPILEQYAYKSATAMSVSLDLIRPQLLAARSDRRVSQIAMLNEYWRRAHVMAQFLLLAADREAGTWLAAMADEFVWINWTPTFPLLRERTIWLAACAARSAAAFGPPVVSKYLAVLQRARHPFKAFDALFGLAAIALTYPGVAPAIATELRQLRGSVDESTNIGVEYIMLAYEDAIALIEDGGIFPGGVYPEVRALGWRDRSPRGLATEQALRADPTAITKSGHYLGFAALPTILRTPIGSFNPDKSRLPSHQIVKAPAVARILRRAWASDAEPPNWLH